MEVPIQLFLTYAWNPARWPAERLPEYLKLWAEREPAGTDVAGGEPLRPVAALRGFNRGDTPFAYEVMADQPWVTVSHPSGTVSRDQRVAIDVRWANS